MKTILMVSHSTSLTGAPLLLCDVAARLDRSKYDLRFIVPDDGPLRERFQRIGPTVVEPLYPKERKYWREIKRFSHRLSVLRDLKPDLVYCNTIHPAKWLAYARFLGIPTLTHVHELSMGFSTLGRVEHAMVRNYSRHFIAVSEAVRNFLTHTIGIQSDLIHTVKLGIDPERTCPTGNPSAVRSRLGLEGTFVVGIVGRITFMKGSDLFLHLATEVKSKLSPAVPVKFLVVATTEDREFMGTFNRLLGAYGLQRDVIVIEDERDVADYYQAMDIYVSCAREDPFPLVILEAMAASLPVVAFAVGGIPEQVTPECGALVTPLDVDQMVAEVLRFVENPGMSARMGAAGRARVMQHFDINRNFSKIEALLDSILEGDGDNQTART